MSDISSELVFEILSILETLLSQLLLSFFLWKLCRAYLGNRKNLQLIAVSYYVTILVLWQSPVQLDSFWAYLLGMLAAFLVMAWLCEGNIYIKIFLSVTFFSIRWQGLSMITQVHQPLFDWESRMLNRLTDGHFAQVWQWNMIHIALYMVVDLVMVWLLFSVIINFMIQKFPLKNRGLSARETVFLLTPGILGYLNYYIIHWIYVNYETKEGGDFFSLYPYFHIIVLLCNVLALLSMFVVMLLFTDLEQKKEEESRQIALESQLHQMQSHIREIEQLYGGIRGMKHDVKNHITAMEGLIEQKKYEEARNYLASMNHTVERLDYAYQTGNPVTDVIINEKCSRAGELGIRFESAFHFPMEKSVDAFDISIILNNALENALEAAGQTKEGYIKIVSSQRRNVYLIEVENNFIRELMFDSKSGLPETTKQETAIHGMGLKNIRRVAEKYYGTIEIEVKEKRFFLTIMLMVK